MTELRLPLAWDRAAEVLQPAGAVEAGRPEHLHHARQQLLGLRLRMVEPGVAYRAVPGIAHGAISAEDIRRAPSQRRDLRGRHREGGFEVVRVGVVAGDVALVDDDVRLGHERFERRQAVGTSALQRLRAVIVRRHGASGRELLRHGDQPPASVLHEVPLVVRVVALVDFAAVAPALVHLGPPVICAVCGGIGAGLRLRVHPQHQGLSPAPLGAVIAAKLLRQGLQSIVVRLHLREDLIGLDLQVEEQCHEADPLGTVQDSGVERDLEFDIPVGV
mmetsp:Transcript_131545/g.366618  ORF Transcript_131545/g.366618 Transcript_131545/m.366618 type:complete len:275 (+) Transcript_131545:419-1243(+)